MKLPDSLRIGGLDWLVKGDENDNLDASALWGQTSEKSHTIRIDTSAQPWKVCETLVHEMIHAIEYSFVSSEKLRLTDQHIKVLAVGLIMTFRDNPALKDILFSEETP